MPALGEQFRAAREARGLSLSDVAEQIRIRSVYLGEIEAENWGAIGAPVYVRGFLRTYARFLGLDPEEAVLEFNKTAAAAPVAPAASTGLSGSFTPGPGQNRGLSPLIWVASGIALVLIGFVIYNYVALRSPASSSVSTSAAPRSQATTLPSNTPSPALLPSAAAANVTKTISVRVTSASWLRVTVDGNVSIEGTFPPGTSKEFHGKVAAVRVGNAGGVEIVVDGKSVGKLGKTGDVAERTFTL